MQSTFLGLFIEQSLSTDSWIETQSFDDGGKCLLLRSLRHSARSWKPSDMTDLRRLHKVTTEFVPVFHNVQERVQLRSVGR